MEIKKLVKDMNALINSLNIKESVEDEFEYADNKRKKKAYVKAVESLEELQTVLEEGVDPATGLLDDFTNELYQKIQDCIDHIYSASLVFDESFNESNEVKCKATIYCEDKKLDGLDIQVPEDKLDKLSVKFEKLTVGGYQEI